MPLPPTPNLNLILPTENDDDDVWDTILNDALSGPLDQHDHTAGKGVAVPSAGLNIDADVPWGTNAITGLKAVDFEPVIPGDVAAFAGAFFVSSVDGELYYRTTTGSNVKVTSGAALNVAGFTGGIGGDYSAVGALVAYVDANNNYTFKQEDPGGGRPWAGLASGQVDIFEQNTIAVNRVRLQSPAALAASYALTLFAALPASTVVVQLTAAGVLLESGTIVNDLSIATGKNLVLDGNGIVAHDDYLLTVPVVYPDVVVESGSVANNGANVGATQAITTVAYYPIRGIDAFQRVKSIKIQNEAAPGAPVTYEWALTGVGGFVPFAVSGDIVVSAAAAPVLALGTPMSMYSASPGDPIFFWIKVTTPGGTAVTPVWFVVTYDAVDIV